MGTGNDKQPGAGGDPPAGGDRKGGDGDPATPKLASWQWIVVLGIAVVLILMYLWFAWKVYKSRGDEAEQWARGLVIFTGIEALAFAAAGWLFGREVNRAAVASAEKNADKANQAANDAREDTNKVKDELTTAQARAGALAAAVSPMTRSLDQGSQWSEVQQIADAVRREYLHVT